MADGFDYDHLRRKRMEDIQKSQESDQYATHIDRTQRPLLDAKEDDPHVNASTVAEYAFCPLAALLTHEGRFNDLEEEAPSTALLPWYKLDAIEEEFRVWAYALWAMPVVLVGGSIILSLFLIGTLVFPLVLLVWVLAWSYVATQVYFRWRKSGERRLAAMHASECNPDPNKTEFQQVDWWGLLKAGYDVERREAALSDEKWRLSGKPRRILRKGSLSIPVHRVNRTEGPLLSQHIVRVMALCHLIEATEGASSPFAVILFGNTYKGTTVPNTPAHREQFYSALESVRTLIKDSDARRSEPLKPLNGSICSQCPFGKPRPASTEDKTMRYDVPVAPFLLHNGQKMFHCDCGDRFKWKPKHRKNEKLRRVD